MSSESNVKFRLNNSELWGGLIGFALGGFVIWSGLKLKLGTINDPGSGFVLFYTGILMCLFAASIIISALTEGGPTFDSRWVFSDPLFNPVQKDSIYYNTGYGYLQDTYTFKRTYSGCVGKWCGALMAAPWTMETVTKMCSPAAACRQ